VAFVWQWDFVDVANWLDANPTVTDATVGGLSSGSMDGPSLDLLMRRQNVAVRWCDLGSPIGSAGGLLVPAQGGALLVPSVVPIADALGGSMPRLETAEVRGDGGFSVSELDAPTGGSDPLALYEGHVALLSFEVPTRSVQPGQTLNLLSRWQSLGDVPADMKAFVHLVDDRGDVWVQHDGLDCPSRFWREGDMVVQVHFLVLPADLPPGVYSLRVGLYGRQALTPYPLVDGSSSYGAGTLEVTDA
jgi:hypothetical protein